MPIKKNMIGIPSDLLAANGLFYQDWSAITACQRECTRRLGMTIQIEQDAYMTQHPEVTTMLEIFIAKMARLAKRKDVLQATAEHFTRPAEELDKEVRERLDLPPDGPYLKDCKPAFYYTDKDLEGDLRQIISKHYPMEHWKAPSQILSTPNTVSSSFISIITSQTTQPTPEPIPTPEPTLSQNMFVLVSNTVDKAIFSHVDDYALRYDTAYVELQKVVEECMEIPVIEIREDIAELIFNAYKMFELNIMEKERIAAEIAWEKRMRKKLKKSLRRMDNFKGKHREETSMSENHKIRGHVISAKPHWARVVDYGPYSLYYERRPESQQWEHKWVDVDVDTHVARFETPPTPKSQISSHESYKKPPPRPCECNPPFFYNRYPKDRFGIYLPRDATFCTNNITATPAVSTDSLNDMDDENFDAKSATSRKSAISRKSVGTRKSVASRKNMANQKK